MRNNVKIKMLRDCSFQLQLYTKYIYTSINYKRQQA